MGQTLFINSAPYCFHILPSDSLLPHGKTLLEFENYSNSGSQILKELSHYKLVRGQGEDSNMIAGITLLWKGMDNSWDSPQHIAASWGVEAWH